MFKQSHHGDGLIALGLSAGLVSMGLNVVHSASIALWAVPIVVLTESARIYIPFVVADKGWSKFLKSVFAAVITLCLFTSTSFLADTYVMRLLGRGKQETVAAQKVERIKELKADIEGIKKQCDAQAASKDKLPNCNLSSSALTELAAKEEGRKDKPGCGTLCQNYKTAAGVAERREGLEKDLTALVTETQKAEVIETNGLGAFIGWATGLGTEKGTIVMMAIGGALLLYTLDLLVYTIILGCQYRRDDRKARKAESLGVAHKPIVTDSAKKIGKQEAYDLLINRLLEMPEGSMLTSRRQLCKIILGTDKRKTTFNEWMNQWIKEGKLLVAEKIEGKSNGANELISLPRKAA